MKAYQNPDYTLPISSPAVALRDCFSVRLVVTELGEFGVKGRRAFVKKSGVNSSINTGTRLSWFLYVSASFLSQEGRTAVSAHLGHPPKGADRRATRDSTVGMFNKVQTTGNVAVVRLSKNAKFH